VAALLDVTWSQDVRTAFSLYSLGKGDMEGFYVAMLWMRARDAKTRSPSTTREAAMHAMPLELDGLIVRQHHVREHPGASGAHLVEEAGHVVLVVLLEHLVLVHSQGRHPRVRQRFKLARTHVNLLELGGLAQRHQHLAAEPIMDAVSIVLVRDVEVLLVGLTWESRKTNRSI